MPTTEEVYDQLRQVFAPEIPVNIVDLGLIYDVKVEEPKVLITMTLTSQSCPEARTIPDVMRRRCNSLDGVDETDIEIVFEPAWTPHLISDEGRKALGMDPTRGEPPPTYWTTSRLPAGPGGRASGLVLSSSFQEIMRALAPSASASSIIPLRW